MKLAFKKFAVLGLLGLAIFGLVGCDWFGTTTTPTTTTTTTTTTSTTTTTTTTPTTTSTTTTTTTTPTTTTTLSDAEKVQAVYDALDLGDVSAVTEDLVLPEPTTNGVSVSWSSSDEDWVTDNGEITTPTYVGGARTVVLTATITLNAVTMNKTFDVTVAKETIEHFLTRAGNAIIITGADNITANFTLPDSSLGCEVTWVSADPAMVAVSATSTSGLFTATVVRPKAEEGGVNTTVILTATISYDDESLDVDKNVRIIAEPLATVYTSFETLHNTASLAEYVDVTGVVYSKFYLGYFLVDDLGKYLAVYTTSGYAGAVAIGDEVRIKGKYAVYNTLYQISNLTFQEVLTHDNVTGITPIVLTDPTDLLDVDSSDRLIHGQIYTITVTPQIRGTYGNVYLFDGETQIATVYYNSLSSSIDVLESYVGQKITINVTYYTFYSGSSVLVPGVPEIYITFDGAAEDVVIPELTDAEKLAADVLGLVTPTAVFGGQPVTLPTAGGYLSVITWAVTAGTNATISGTKVTYADVATSQSVTLTATLTLGAQTPATKEFVVTITPITTSTIAAVKTLDPADLPFVQMEGVIYFIYTRGYYIQDETGQIAIYVGAVPSASLVLGDKVVIIGTLATYKDQLQITSPVVKSETSAGNDYAQIATPYVPGTTVLVSGATYAVTCDLFNGIVASVDAVNSNVYLMNGETVLGLIYYRTNTDSLNALKAATGKEATINVVYYYHSYGTAYFVYQEGTAGIVLTDAQLAIDENAALTINQSVVSGDIIVLPTTSGTSTVTWALATTTYATLDAATLTIAAATETRTITLTATLSHPVSGGDPIVSTKDFEVTISTLEVKLAADKTALTVANQTELSTLTLPTTGSNGSAISWALAASTDASLAVNVLTMNYKGSAYSLTLTATLTLSTYTDTKEIVITVNPVTVITELSTVNAKTESAWTVADGNVYLRGVVTYLNGTAGVFIQDASGDGMYCYGINATTAGLVVGDEVIVYGGLTTYNSVREMVSTVLKVELSAGNALVNTTMTPAEVAAILPIYWEYQGKLATVTGLTVDHYTGNYVYLNWTTVESTEYYLSFNYTTSYSWWADVYPAGSTLPAVSFLYYNIYSVTTYNITGVTSAAITEAQKAAYDASKIPTTLADLVANYTLPTAKYLSTYSAVISAELTSYVSYAGGVLTITLPAAGTVSGTVTITVTNGAATQDVVIAVSVKALTDAEKLAAALADLPSTMTMYTGYTLPTLDYSAAYGTLTISAELTANLSEAAGVLSITRPASGASDVVGTFTVNASLNAENASKVITITVKAYATALYFSEYIEGSANNKALEIYNDTGVAVDLSTYTVCMSNDTDVDLEYNIPLTGTLAAGDVFVIINDQADLAGLLAVDDMVHGSICDFNGDDTMVLKNGATVVDTIGQLGTDPGTNWNVGGVATSEMTLVRKLGSIDADSSNVYDPSAQWTAYAQNTTSYLGSHTLSNILG